METIAVLVGLLAIMGPRFGLVNIVYPIKRLRVQRRRMALGIVIVSIA